MAASNVTHHRIEYGALARRGFLVGMLSAVVMAVLAMVVGPLVAASNDIWTFPKIVSTIALGDGAAAPLTGFEAAPVLVGLVLHLLIGGLVGAVFAALIGLFDVEGTVPVMVAGMIYGAVVFLTAYVLIGRLLFDGFAQLPLIVAFWSHIAFGVFAGFALGHWQRRFDTGKLAPRAPAPPRVDPETAAFSMVFVLAVLAVLLAYLAIDFVVSIAIVCTILAIFGAGAWWMHHAHAHGHESRH